MGICKEESSDSVAEMGYNANNEWVESQRYFPNMFFPTFSHQSINLQTIMQAAAARASEKCEKKQRKQ